ncbi:MAG TPA: heparan-alpha-glucosaminide N-acetyltransferase domain-containing protein [Bryobacteraceae bacterium]|jgi:uncharacterized membrane protein|nr:heparan-alpha-glucosaminide N-acetyltransferase domain-containing protein [Bryobacteraceae bacterium]
MSTQVVTAASSVSASRPASYRLESIDLLRGLLMLLMALDHTRDFFSVPTGDPGDPLTSWPALFATRWITHLCAPGFIALAGISVYLQRRRGKSAEQMTRMLLTRGVWLILLEVTVVSFAWAFSPSTYLQVIWAIGVSMICLGLLQLLSRAVAAAVGIPILLLHNLLDPIRAASFGRWALLWNMIHQPLLLRYHGSVIFVIIYPVLPCIGVILVGYVFGPFVCTEPHVRQRMAVLVGGLFLSVFSLLRLTHGYGDPREFQHLAAPSRTVMSFLDVEKYPLSLHFVLATVGVLLLVYALFDAVATRGWLPRLRGFLEVFGRVPFFFYVLHLYLLHSAALLLSVHEHLNWHYFIPPRTPHGGDLAGWGLSLPLVYCVWLGVILALYLPCWWFGRLKARRRDWWLSYL